MIYKLLADGIGGLVTDAAKGTMNSIKETMAVSQSIGRMEFGSGKSLETKLGSTERSRAISAMQNVGLSARSYLGQEAKIIAQG